ncbi:MAG: hypothetical protein EX260_08410 [Desulfobulbaceae bacterium]|nr:MAG: hypothetical protein EX260_08410 [Desulfobulbaceae bacterium]
MNPSVLEKLWSVEKEAEIWWDSSPLVFETWKKSMIDQAENKEEMTTWIDRMFHPDNAPEDNLFRGVTTNPPLSHAAVQDNPAYWRKWIADYVEEHGSQETEVMFWQVYKEIIKRGAETFLPMFEKTGGKFGYISGQTDPRSKFDTAVMVSQGAELAAIAPNVMIKVPGTAEGYETIRILSSKGISTNNTPSMINPQFKACMDAVAAGENVVYTSPPPYIGDLLAKTPYLEFSDSTHERVPQDVLDKLLKIPYFARAYSEDGYTAAEFNTHPALLETARQFAGVTEKMVNFVSEALVACKRHKN